MKNSKKLMITGILLAVIAVVTVAPTLSWLSDVSQPVVNTFAGGAISIYIDEALVDTDGKALTGDDAQRVTSNSYKYVAGEVLDKDPTPTILKGSEECYVFLYVENYLNSLFALNYDTDSWLEIAESDNGILYVYKTTVDASESDVDLSLEPIFTTVTVSEDLTAEDIEELGEKTISVTAYAVQASSITSQAAIDLAVAQFLPEGAEVQYPTVN